MRPWNFYSAGQLVFGSGSRRQIGLRCVERDYRRVLIVTDPVLVKAGLLEEIHAPLKQAGIEVDVFAGGCPEPSIEIALQAIEQAKNFKPLAILGLGGGSNMDLAKIVALAHAHGGTPRDYFGWNNVPGPVTPIVCVPTTAGTGSEVSHAAVLTDAEHHIKVSTLSNHLRPALAVVDAELTLSCPPKPTADSGIDALTHAIEAYTATPFDRLAIGETETTPYDGSHPLGDLLAERAIELIGKHLINAVEDGQNIIAREGMALAATLAGLAFSNCGVAVVHALEYPVGGAIHVSHGAGNGLLLPYVMRFNLPAASEKLACVAKLLGEAPLHEATFGQSEAASAEQAIAAVEKLRAAIGIPQRLRDLGLARDILPLLAAKAHAIKRLMLTNPRLPSEADLLGIYEAAW